MKAKIRGIGTVVDGAADGWAFDAKGCDVAGLTIGGEEPLIAGWRASELKQLSDLYEKLRSDTGNSARLEDDE